MFEIETAPTGEIVLSGRLDATQVDKARKVLFELDESRTIYFSRLDYIASAGLGVLLATQKKLSSKGCSIRFVNVNHHIRDVLHFSGFDQIFEIG